MTRFIFGLLAFLVILSIYRYYNIQPIDLVRVAPLSLPTAAVVGVVFVVHTTGSTARWRDVRETWVPAALNHDAAVVAFGESVIDGDLPVIDVRGRNPFERTRFALETALLMYPQAHFFVKSDDDTYLYVDELLAQLTPAINYAGYPLVREGQVYASGGAGYVLSKAAVGHLARNCKGLLHEFEDVGVGQCLSPTFPLTDLVGLHPHNPWQMLRWDKHGHPPDHVRQGLEPLQGYLKPLSYHYVDLKAVHDTGENPKRIHQFWVGDNRDPPLHAVQSCREMHPDWEYTLWNDELIKQRFPHGQLVNQDFYDRAGELNLKSDIARYEFLLFFGGIYMDADSLCIRPLDSLWRDRSRGFCVFENEQKTGDLVATGVLSLPPYSPLAMVLVQQLQNTNWGEPAWISAGPKYATDWFKRLNADIVRLPSHLFYPFHYSDSRVNVPERLRDTGAFTDQLWGTTHGAYPNHEHVAHPLTQTEPALTGNSLLDRYTQVHARGISTLAIRRPRWIVLRIANTAGLCNRFMTIVSALALGILTDRAVLFDWPHSEPVNSGAESIGQANFYDIFAKPPIAFELQRVLAYHHIKLNDFCPHTVDSLINPMLDLDSQLPQSVLVIERYDFWGAALFQHFKLPSLPELFAYLFTPRVPVSPNTDCGTLVQHRTRWERQSAPLDALKRCARDSFPDDPITVVSDTTSYCRNGSAVCDLETVQQMVSLSACRNAVLTHTSTFGGCIAALIGSTKNIRIVTSSGECLSPPIPKFPLVEIGTLPGQERQVEASLKYTAATPGHRRAFVFLAHRLSGDKVAELRRTLWHLHDKFNKLHHYPIVLFVDRVSEWDSGWLQAENSVRIHLVEIDPKEWRLYWPDDAPAIFKLPSHPDHTGFSRGYREMSAYSAKHLFTHPFLVSNFDVVIKMDGDTHPVNPWPKDPFEEMVAADKVLGFWIRVRDLDDVSHGQDQVLREDLGWTRDQLKQPDLVWDRNDGFQHLTYYGCFMAFRPGVMAKDPDYRRLVDAFDRRFLWQRHRADEQDTLVIWAARALRAEQVLFMSFMGRGIEHQVWATEPRIID